MREIEDIITALKSYLPSFDAKVVYEAFYFAEDLGLKSVFPDCTYREYVMELIEDVLPLEPDLDSIIALIIHGLSREDSVEDYDISTKFGADVKRLLRLLGSINTLEHTSSDADELENFRKFLLVTAEDFRVVMIVICIEINILRNAEKLPPHLRRKKAREAIDIYAQLAARLGMYRLKSRLEDLAFRYIEPALFKEIEADVVARRKSCDQDIELMKKTVMDILKNEHIEATVVARVKHYYGIYLKLKRKGKSTLEDILDFFAIRIILPDRLRNGEPFYGHCYQVLGIIYSYFTPIAHRFKDYISVPKVNGYRSLHTTVQGFQLDSRENPPVEIQIRTKSMHREAEYGIAAHWLYNVTKAASSYNRDIFNQPESYFDTKDLKTHHYNLNLFRDRVFVLDSHGQVKNLPKGSTCVDLAYYLGEETGHQCILAKVNKMIVPLNYTLRNGDVVDISIKQGARPNRYWLSFVKTDKARQGIANFYKQYDLKVHTLLAARQQELMSVKKQERSHRSIDNRSLTERILIAGSSEFPLKISGCCSPEYGQPICGYITRGKGVSVHKHDCRVFRSLEKERFMEVSWK